jgi:hypothetical protein
MARFNRIPTSSFLFFSLSLSFLLVLLSQPTPTYALSPISSSSYSSSGMSFCRCACFGNSTIIPLYRPTTPSAPCLTCTRQFCLDQKLSQCVGAKGPQTDQDLDTATGEEGDVEARCFRKKLSFVSLYLSSYTEVRS